MATFPRDVAVLIVDDVKGIRFLTAKALRSLGFKKIAEASDGQDALNKLKEGFEGEKFQLILADIQMPGMDGLQFLKKVREIPEHVHTAMVMVSAESDKNVIMSAVNQGVSDYIVKPLDVDLLNQKLDRIWSKTKS